MQIHKDEPPFQVPQPGMPSQDLAGFTYNALSRVLEPEQLQAFFACSELLKSAGKDKEATDLMNLVCDLAESQYIEWIPGDTPPVQDDASYWLSIENKHNGHRFVRLHTYYNGPGWDNMYAKDKARFRILAYCRAVIPEAYQF